MHIAHFNLGRLLGSCFRPQNTQHKTQALHQSVPADSSSSSSQKTFPDAGPKAVALFQRVNSDSSSIEKEIPWFTDRSDSGTASQNESSSVDTMIVVEDQFLDENDLNQIDIPFVQTVSNEGDSILGSIDYTVVSEDMSIGSSDENETDARSPETLR